MTKLVFLFYPSGKDEETLLRADETDITIVLHSAEYGVRTKFNRIFIGRGRKKRLLFVIFVSEIQ